MVGMWLGRRLKTTIVSNLYFSDVEMQVFLILTGLGWFWLQHDAATPTNPQRTSTQTD